MLKKMDHSPKSYFLFSPDKGHYTNAMSLYIATKRALIKKYYGAIPKEKNKELTAEEEMKK